MHRKKQSTPLILASSSPYRRRLLQRLGLEFKSQSPGIDETRAGDESAERLVTRLAAEKARHIAVDNPRAVIIGSDQVATVNGEILTKPLDHDGAVRQLEKLSGNIVRFLTGLCVLNAVSGREQSETVPFEVCFRILAAGEIERYLLAERPYDCAGSFKSEGLGISLMQSMKGDDPTALVGLPLLRLSAMLREEGFEVP